MTGIGSNSSSVPASALVCWGSKSEIRREESAGDESEAIKQTGAHLRWLNFHITGGNKSSSSPPLGCVESPDNRLKSSRTEAAEVGAEETEEEPLPAAGGADGAEIREQPSRESSAVSGSETGRRETEFGHSRNIQGQKHTTPYLQPSVTQKGVK